MKWFSVICPMLSIVASSNAATILIDFEKVPALATGPSTFDNLSPQTVTVPNVATITGGVVLGNPASFPAQSFATSPNVYATAGFDSNLSSSSTLTVSISPSFPTTEVSFPVFNGASQTESYIVTAFNGANVVATQTLANLPANGSSSFGIVDLKASNITSVTVAPVTLNATCCNGFDFVIDSIALNEPVQSAVVPEPETLSFTALAFAAALLFRKYKK